MADFFAHLPATGYVCAHRGARSIAPENTLLALELARDCGAALWETDVQMTADEQLVLFHDRTLGRTTDSARCAAFAGRRNAPLSDFRLDELHQLDAGSWFLDADPFGTVASGEVDRNHAVRVAGQKIPTLRAALEDCRAHNFPVNLELKGQLPPPRARRRIEVLLTELVRAQCEDLVLLSSFVHDDLRLVRQLHPTLATAALVERQHPGDLLDYLAQLQVAAYHPAQEITDAALIARLRDAGFRVNTWTVNEPQRMAYFRDAGATFICTDWPQRML